MSSLFAELKRRKVFRVAVVYAATAFVILQAADIMLPSLGVPGWALSLVVMLVILGFPIALVLAWALELTPEGIKRTEGAAVEAGEAGAAPALLGKRTVLISALLVAVGVGLGAGWFLRPMTTPEMPVGPSAREVTAAEVADPRVSIAVLPFADLSPEGDQGYFSDGIAEEILNVLARVEGLRVASRTSSFLFKGERKSIPVIAEELGVAHVLEGSVRKAGDQVRITAQLIAADGDAHLWSDTYDGELSAASLFALQDRIATAIVAALQEHLGYTLEGAVEVAAVTADLDAYELYLQARAAGLSIDGATRRVELLERAVAIDPAFAEAWAALAHSLVNLPTWRHDLEPRPYLERGIEAAERSLTLDDSNRQALVALRSAYFYLHDWERADQVLVRAAAAGVDLQPRALELMGLGYLSRAHKVAEAVLRQTPDNAFHKAMKGLYLEAVGRPAEALEWLDQSILGGYHGGLDKTIADIHWLRGHPEIWTIRMAGYLTNHDPELLPLLPHLRDLRQAGPAEQAAAVQRFRAIARELGFEIDDLVARGPRWALRVPGNLAVKLGHSESVAEVFWTNVPKFWMWGPRLHEFRQSEAFRQRVRDSGMLAYWQANGWPDLCRPIAATSDPDDFECD